MRDNKSGRGGAETFYGFKGKGRVRFKEVIEVRG
jgi:hypothetical protein